MKFDSIKIKSDGYIDCRSCFYFVQDVMEELVYDFSVGVNTLSGEIDSGNWGVSYLLSMYGSEHKYEANKKYLSATLSSSTVMVNNEIMSMEQLWKYTCYMDEIYPLFSTKKTVRRLIERGIKKNDLSQSAEDIRELFHIDEQRFERPIKAVGNERFKAMAAVGYVYGKQVFCFPWLSKRRFDAFHYQIVDALCVLTTLEKIVILPYGGLPDEVSEKISYWTKTLEDCDFLN